jgi:uncharacterized protein (TIGR00255 family)
MLQSMTGFGKASCQWNHKNISIEIRCLNSKQLDVNLRLPNLYKEKEGVLRNLISQHIIRGKADVVVNMESTNGDTGFSLNKGLIKKYYQEISELRNELNTNDNSDILAAILRFPEVLKTSNDELIPEEWEALNQAFMEAIVKTISFRNQEGLALENDISLRIEGIEVLLGEIEPHEAERIQSVKNRLQKGLEDMADTLQSDPNRFEQELIYYIEKLDITEEKTRLTKHLEHFRNTMQQEDANGRKLGFIAQEMGREINTIGSKASYAPMQKIVVQMKDELEKIKEQLLNIL